jgi:hypothetical protein
MRNLALTGSVHNRSIECALGRNVEPHMTDVQRSVDELSDFRLLSIALGNKMGPMFSTSAGNGLSGDIT